MAPLRPELRASAVFARLLMRPRAGPVIAPIVRAMPGILTFGARDIPAARDPG